MSRIRVAVQPLLLLLGALLVLFTQGVQAQQPGTITGTAVSEATSRPIPSVAVWVRRMTDSVLVASVITDNSGRFSTSVPTGDYRVEITSVGHQPVERSGVTITATVPRQDLGILRMPVAVVEVAAVTATGQRSEVVIAPDRSVYNIRDMPVVQGGAATDALRAIPELEVDVEDNIRARGGEPLIMLDGRPLPMQGAARTAFLRSLQANRIDRIEYIPNPSSRYEADGQSGIINIVLRRDASLGLSGTLSANAGTRGTQNLSSRLNYQRGSMTFFGGGQVGFNQSESNSLDYRQNRVSTPVTFLQQTTSRESTGMNGGADLTTELKLSDRSTAWTIFRGNRGGSEDSSLSEFVHMDHAETPYERYERENNNDNSNYTYSGAIGLRRVVEAQRNEFSTELRYNANGSDRNTENYRFLQQLTGGRQGLDPDLTSVGTDSRDGVWTLQADLSRPFSETLKIDVGYRGSWRDHRNLQALALFTAASGQPASEGSHLFQYQEGSNAGYINFDQRFGRLSVQGGLRAEMLDGTVRSPLLGEEAKITQEGLFPSANVGYDFGNGRDLRFSYSKRIQRPSSGQLNPVNSTPTDPFNISRGNPYLTPADLHSLSLDGSWSGNVGSLRSSAFLYRGVNLWDQIRTVDAAGALTGRPENVASVYQVGVGLNGSVRQVGPFSGSLNLGLFYQEYEGGPESRIPPSSSTSWNTSGNITTTVRPSLRVQTTLGYSPSNTSPQGRYSGFRQVNFALTQRVLSDRGVVTLSLVDPFNLSQSTIRSLDPSFEGSVRTTNRIRRAALSLSYNFGRAPQANRRVIQDEPQGGGGLGGAQ